MLDRIISAIKNYYCYYKSKQYYDICHKGDTCIAFKKYGKCPFLENIERCEDIRINDWYNFLKNKNK